MIRIFRCRVTEGCRGCGDDRGGCMMLKCPFCAKEIPRKAKMGSWVRCSFCGCRCPSAGLAALSGRRTVPQVRELDESRTLRVGCITPESCLMPLVLTAYTAVCVSGSVRHDPALWWVQLIFWVILLLIMLQSLFGHLVIRRVPGFFLVSRGVFLRKIPVDEVRLFKLGRSCSRNGYVYRIDCLLRSGTVERFGTGLPPVRLAAAVRWLESRILEPGGENPDSAPFPRVASRKREDV